jgi:hypothetical protein
LKAGPEDKALPCTEKTLSTQRGTCYVLGTGPLAGFKSEEETANLNPQLQRLGGNPAFCISGLNFNGLCNQGRSSVTSAGTPRENVSSWGKPYCYQPSATGANFLAMVDQKVLP